MTIRIVQFIAMLLTALALAPGGAHVLEMANKIGLDRDHYVTVQQIYRGWSLLGVILIAAIIANAVATFLLRRQAILMAWSAAAAILLCLGLAISSLGRIRRTRRPITGRFRRPIGRRCLRSGSFPTPGTPSSRSWRCVRH
ncbi:MAG TPA: hypothetical protein VGM32_08630 [Rhodopila sp.]